MRAPRQPLLFATLAFAGGIWLGTYVWRPASWWLVAFAVFSMAATLSCKSRRFLAATFCLGALVFLGALSIQIKHPVLGLSPQILPFADGHEVTVVAHVTENGVVREGGYGRREVVEVETESICSADATHDLQGKIRMTFYSRSDPKTNEACHAGMPGFIYGQRLRFIAKLRPPRNFGNPGAFDYRSYLAAHGVIALGSASLESVEVLPGFVGDRFDLWRNQIRHSLLEKIHVLWPERQAGLWTPW